MERREEAHEAVGWQGGRVGCLGVQKPLYHRDAEAPQRVGGRTAQDGMDLDSDSSGKEERKRGLVPDGTVEASGSKAKALPDVMQEQITFDLPVECDLWPIRKHTIPGMGKKAG